MVRHETSSFHYLSFADDNVIDAHGHDGAHAAHGPEGDLVRQRKETTSLDEESLQATPHGFLDSVVSQCVGIAILEFGCALHR
jgi:solute carrier family 39 (zinc transporter), member 1/2/3